jgi:hypothetical protein
MCNLYSQRKPREELRGLFNISHNRAVDVEPQAGILPGYMAPVVRRAEDGDLELVKLSLGFCASARGLRAQARHERSRRPNPQEQVLARLVRGAALPGAGDLILRTKRRCKASNLALSCLRSSTNAATCAFPIDGTVGAGADRQARRGAERKASVDQSLIRGLNTALPCFVAG